MNIERITVAFHAEDDRLMMRVFFDQKAEFQSWLTRRLVKRIWPVLLQMAQAKPDIQMQPNLEVRKALVGLQHEEALQQVKFSKAAAEPAREHPLGNAPMLVSKVRARRNERGQTVLSLQSQQGNGVDLALSDTLLHGLMKLVQDAVAKAEWDTSLAVPTFAHALAEEDSGRTVN